MSTDSYTGFRLAVIYPDANAPSDCRELQFLVVERSQEAAVRVVEKLSGGLLPEVLQVGDAVLQEARAHGLSDGQVYSFKKGLRFTGVL